VCVCDIVTYFDSPSLSPAYFSLSHTLSLSTRAIHTLTHHAGPNERVTLQYMFMTAPSLDPVDFWLSGGVHYNDSEASVFRTTWVNQSVALTASESEFDLVESFRYW
jgi:hypothetical protein